MTDMTIRNIPPEPADALDRVRQRRGTSLNQTVIQLPGLSPGVAPAEAPGNGLARLAGSRTKEDSGQFGRAAARGGSLVLPA